MNREPPRSVTLSEHDLSPAMQSAASITGGVDRDPVEHLAAEFVERLRRGEPVTIDDYASRYPQWSAAIRALFPTIAAMEGMRAMIGPTPVSTLTEIAIERLGDFRIVREIGRGGMGIVYEAEQESLRRRVAVKVLSPKLLSAPRHIERFRVEAQTAAGLHHTNIVPVFGVGEQDGLHYYVMQLIEGAGLDQALTTNLATVEERPGVLTSRHSLDTHALAADTTGESSRRRGQGKLTVPGSRSERIRWAVDLARQVAHALQYAHEHGTLHRDIKPGNLIVDYHGVVRVTDFGLATALAEGRTSAESEIVGTLRYMAPEQFASVCDARTDIYSLGITLYELIVGAPAFAEQDKSRLIKTIRRGELPRLRRREPAVSRDLDAIVARATAANPDHRYQTASQFADDLGRCLDDRPVSARPVTLAGRFVRWARRNPGLATLNAFVAVLLVSIAAVSSIGYRGVQSALNRESAQRQKAAATAHMASETLDRIFSRFDPQSGDGVQPVLSPEMASLLQNLLSYYDELASQAGDDLPLRQKGAVARRRVGDIRQRLGEYGEAVKAYEDAAGRESELATTGIDVRGELTRIFNELGRCYAMLDRAADARQAHQTALELLEPWRVEQPTRQDVVYELARTHYLLGRSLRPGQSPATLPTDMFVQLPPHRLPGEPPHFGPPPRPGEKFRPGEPPPRPGDTGPEWDDPRRPPRKLGPSGAPPDHPNSPQHAQIVPEHLHAAIALLREIVPDAETGPAASRQLLASCYRELVNDHLLQRNEADRTAQRQAIELWRALIKESPHNPDYRYGLMETLAQFDVFSAPPLSEPFDEALKYLQEALEHGDQLMQERPDVAEYVLSVIHVYFKHGTLQQRRSGMAGGLEHDQALTDAVRSFRRAVNLQRNLSQQHPDVRGYQAWWARFLIAEAAALREQGETAKSQQALADAEARLTELATAGLAEQVKSLQELLAGEKRATEEWARQPRPERDSRPPPRRGGPPPGGPKPGEPPPLDF